jgi:peptide deformylase
MESFDYIQDGEELNIVVYPDPVLSKKALPVTEFTPELKSLAQNMLHTMYKAPGIGLACPQIGQSIRMFVLDTKFTREQVTKPDGTTDYKYSNMEPLVLINPEITPLTEEKIKYQEGCLSLPTIYDDVMRYKEISVKYKDLDGNECEMKADGLLSVCIQHENDHLDGVVFIERLSMIKKNLYRKKITNYKKRYI